MRIAIVGGGIIGLACALRLARRGHDITLCDANSESREASWAAAGMLAPHNEAKQADHLWSLCCESFKQWPTFIDELGVDARAVDFREHGSLEPVIPGDDVRELEHKAALLAEAGAAIEWLERADIERREAGLHQDIERALWMPGGQVDPRRVCTQLRARCAEIGVELRYRDPVHSITDNTILMADGTELAADQVLLAAGAWTPKLSQMTGYELHGEPVKGQMLAFATDQKLLQHFIHCRHAYMVEREGTGIVVGSTMEYVGFNRQDSQAAIAQLAAGAQRVLPALGQCQVRETWTGLRPRLNGGLPMFKRLNQHLSIATGHFRNGILLTPITAMIMESLVLDEPCSVAHLDSFDGAAALASQP